MWKKALHGLHVLLNKTCLNSRLYNIPSRFLRCFSGWKNFSWTLGQILMSLIHLWCFSKYPRCQGLSFASRLPSFSFVASDWDRLGQAQLHNLIINTKGQVKLRAINVDVSTTNTMKTSSLSSIMTSVVEYQYWVPIPN